jgi:hypothetical protein
MHSTASLNKREEIYMLEFGTHILLNSLFLILRFLVYLIYLLISGLFYDAHSRSASSLAQALGSWVRIPLKVWMFVCVYSVCMCVCGGVGPV